MSTEELFKDFDKLNTLRSYKKDITKMFSMCNISEIRTEIYKLLHFIDNLIDKTHTILSEKYDNCTVMCDNKKYLIVQSFKSCILYIISDDEKLYRHYTKIEKVL